ncbi:MAG: type V CRISPR-associated protein Cas4 [Bacteroidales bacterium]|nr:type V CRISPR-associated protein Cas4 [Bacteroidales bacterium]
MGEDYILLSTLNDYSFCPYSIYLHNIYMETDEGLYHATPQTQGRLSHKVVDGKKSSTRKEDLMAMPVCCHELGIMGKIDIYKGREHHLIERKYQMKRIFQGQLYQVWGEYFCMKEMGYEVDRVSFYEISTNKMLTQRLPGVREWGELKSFIEKYKAFDPSETIETSAKKCAHCIYSALCEKTEQENVY